MFYLSQIVVESLKGLCYANPGLTLLENDKVVYQSNVDEIARKQVTLVAGGGAGHEPAHAAFVGPSMLTAAVTGQVFASPSAGQILTALRAVRSPHGTLVIIKNYTGDCLHFGLATERAKAEGMKVEIVIVGEDVAVGREKGGLVGRRGLAGTILVHKVAGALAAKGATLEQVRHAAQYVASNIATIGVGLDHCHVPGSSSFASLADGEIELGMGIHNEPGYRKTSLPPLRTLVGSMLDTMLDTTDPDRFYLPLDFSKDRVALLVNNLGGTPALELGVVVKEATEHLVSRRGIVVERVISGFFMTSLNMPGFSFTLLRLPSEGGLDFVPLLDEPVGAPAWRNGTTNRFTTDVVDARKGLDKATVEEDEVGVGSLSNREAVIKAIRTAAEHVIAAEPDITSYDTLVGDGDCGHTLKQGANAVLAALPTLPFHTASQLILSLSDILDANMGGTSSALYCIFLNALAAGLKISTAHDGVATASVWGGGLEVALRALERYTPARPGDRTVIDALAPFVETFVATRSIAEAVHRAREGAEATRKMKARLGRASYVSDESVIGAAVPDAGAWGFVALVSGLKAGLEARRD
ncbi:dihydroxyacetone kinase [Jimgerdemannia flammicorona]|uniref:Dihydroxyacetone kinase n=1 Tax=Jimgerdemannia flammicorona TaxID=994334 RepID=A0A433QXK4_9FUNG|nr:dihydroxyacetone kinase [Jimgerdemannia flammicorona]